jgi:cysteine desulfurase
VMMLKDEVAISTGSACTSKSLEPSHVLLALGLSEAFAESTVRFSLGRFTSSEEIERVSKVVVTKVMQMRRLHRSTIG